VPRSLKWGSPLSRLLLIIRRDDGGMVRLRLLQLQRLLKRAVMHIPGKMERAPSYSAGARTMTWLLCLTALASKSANSSSSNGLLISTARPSNWTVVWIALSSA